MSNDVLITIAAFIFASTGFWTFLGTIWVNRSKNKTSSQKLLVGLAFVQIVAKCEFYIRQGWIEVDEYKELKEYLFDPYLDMGGNGIAKHLIDQVEKLPMNKEA